MLDKSNSLWPEIFTDVNPLNFQVHFYQPYGHFVTKRQTPFIDILAASEIRAKYGFMVKPQTSDIRMTYEYIRVTYGSHTSDIRITYE